MLNAFREAFRLAALAGTCMLLGAAITTAFGTEQIARANDAEAETPAPADQQYIGTKRCASCHFKEYVTWKKSAHAKAFDILTAKYQSDSKCLKCHTTGFGEESGFRDNNTTANLAGITCESCHGPGSKHEKIAQPFTKVKELTPEQTKTINDSIWRMLPKNVCVECHTVQSHKGSETPPELRH